MNWNLESRPGDVVEIAPVSDRQSLPTGLTPGFQVRLVRVEADLRVVEREGREWRLRSHQIRPRGLGHARPACGGPRTTSGRASGFRTEPGLPAVSMEN